MNITIKCPACGQVLAVPPNLAGRQATCPKCKSPFMIPAAAPAPVPMATPSASIAPLGRSGPPPLPQSVQSVAAPVSSPAHGPEFDLGSPYSSPVLPPSGKKAIGQSGKTKWIVGAICASVLLVAAAVGGWMILGAKAGIGGDARFLPDDSNLVFTLDVKSIINSGVGRQLKEQLSDLDQLARGAKVKIEDVGRIVAGGRVAGEQVCAVVHFNRPVSIEELLQSENQGKQRKAPTRCMR